MAKKEKEFEYEFNPIKEMKDGKQAEKVVWSTKSLNAAVDAINKGLPLKANPFVGKVTQLLKPNLVYKRTREEIEDYIKCKQDPIYFATKCYIKQPTGMKLCQLRDYQEDYLRHLQKNNFSIWLACRQAGKSVTTVIYCLWVILFNTDKIGLILSKSGGAGADLLKKIKDMYLFLPYHIKCGTMKWNGSEISFDNNSSISTEAFSQTAGLGKTINFLILDEFAWCPPNEVELFYNNIIPTITTDSNANICIMSTQNGFNLFYELYKAAVQGENMYAPFKVDWWQVPEWDKEKKCWVKRTEAWKNKMIGILGSEEKFYYQYGTQFSISNACLVSRECMAKLHKEEERFVSKTSEDYENASISLTLQHLKYLYWRPSFNLEDLKTKHFIILTDLAEGGGGDYTVFNILEVKDKDAFEMVGYWYSNKVSLEKAALEYWLLVCQLFNDGRTLLSIEWNTYGALFYQYLKNFNEPDYDTETAWRYNVPNTSDGIDMFSIIQYKKESIEAFVIGNTKRRTSSFMPGIKFTSGNKHVACSMLKMMLEKGNLKIYDTRTLSELENFEDKSGNGSYQAKIGHDDLIMTLCQIPMLQQTPKFKDFIEEIDAIIQLENIYDKQSGQSIYNII